MKIFDLLYYKALGKVSSYHHKRGKENKQTTNLQNFLSEYMTFFDKV